MTLLDSLASVFGAPKTQQDLNRNPYRRRLSLEQLEDRTVLTTFSVSTLADGGVGSLRQAIEDANATPGADVIEFDVAGTIKLTSGALSNITEQLEIDGTTAPGFVATPVVEIDMNGFTGLKFGQLSLDSTLQSLGIINAASAGVSISGSNTLLVGNFIGVKLDGTTAGGNQGDGVQISDRSSGNTIGGTQPDFTEDSLYRNIISGNGGNGIGVYGSSDNEIIANYIGTDVTGSVDVGNAGNGILLTNGASSNLIGGEHALPVPPPDAYNGKPHQGNVISGNDLNGVRISDNSKRNLLAGNFIGTDVTGNYDVGNSRNGVTIAGNSNRTSLIGAVFTLPDNEDEFTFYNVISGNDRHGLQIIDSHHTVVQANFIGMAADNGLTDPANPFLIGNTLNGVLLGGRSTDTQFGGPIPLGNVVAANGRHGVEIRDNASGFVSDNTFGGMGAFNNSTKFGNKLDGFHITSTGGNIVIETSVIGGNGDDGVEISGDAQGVTVQQSIIGLNGKLPSGFLPLPNGDNGVEIGGNAHHNFIGLTNPQFSVIPTNIISANINNGVAIIGNAHHNQVFGSRIGTNLVGENPIDSPPVGNRNAGVFLGGNSHHNTIGGYGEEDANLIVGNFGNGIELSEYTYQNQIIANLIGSDRHGDEGVGNQGAGVLLSQYSHHNLIQDNLARDNYFSGYAADGSSFNVFGDNQAIANGADGFLLENSDFNSLIRNVAEENLGNGFKVDSSDFNAFIENEALNNLGDGFHVEDSDFNIFIDNQSNNNDGFGFFVEDKFDNIFTNNDCEHNGLGGSNLWGIC